MEILDDDHGVLVGFHDSQAMAQAINALLSDDGEGSALAARAYARGRTMIWTKMAERAEGLRAEAHTTRTACLTSVPRVATNSRARSVGKGRVVSGRLGGLQIA